MVLTSLSSRSRCQRLQHLLHAPQRRRPQCQLRRHRFLRATLRIQRLTGAERVPGLLQALLELNHRSTCCREARTLQICLAAVLLELPWHRLRHHSLHLRPRRQPRRIRWPSQRHAHRTRLGSRWRRWLQRARARRTQGATAAIVATTMARHGAAQWLGAVRRKRPSRALHPLPSDFPAAAAITTVPQLLLMRASMSSWCWAQMDCLTRSPTARS